MPCQHTLTHSTTYPIGTRCSRCGQPVETLFANLQSELKVTQSQLEAANARVEALEENETASAQLRSEIATVLEELHERKGKETELGVELSKQLVQTEALSKENIRLVTKLKEAEGKLEETEAKLMLDKNALRLALEREKELQKKLTGSEATLSIQTDRVIEAENKPKRPLPGRGV